jgi:hypothetical protein
LVFAPAPKTWPKTVFGTKRIFDYRRCVLPSANGDRGRMSYERSDDEAVIGGHSIPTQAPRQFSLSLAQNLERHLIFIGHVASYSSPAPA